MLDAKQRWLVLGGLLTATLAAAAWVHDRDDEDSAQLAQAVTPRDDVRQESAVRARAPERSAQSSVPQVRLDKLDERNIGEASKDPFAVPRPKVKKRARPKPAPVVVVRTPPPPPPPSAPPLPFTYMGKLVEGDEVSVFLTHGSRNLVVHAGDTIDSKYRVDHIADSTMTLTYLPLDQQQTLAFGERE